MVKFLFTRMSEPHQPSWDHHDPTWDTNTRNSPEAVCIRVWDWMRGEKNTEITHQNSLQELKHKLLSDSEKERLEAVYHMGDSGEHSLPILIDALKSQATNHFEENIEKPHTNPSQLDTVVGFSSVGAIGIPYLIKLLSNDHWWLRAAAADPASANWPPPGLPAACGRPDTRRDMMSFSVKGFLGSGGAHIPSKMS